jgi:hypothetical protein
MRTFTGLHATLGSPSAFVSRHRMSLAKSPLFLLPLTILIAWVMCLSSTELARCQDPARTRDIVTKILLGRWIQTATGNLLDLRSNGDVEVDFSDAHRRLRETGTYVSCSDDDANVCLLTPQLKCGFRFRIGNELQLYLQYRSGGDACESLRGEYQRQQPD